VKVSEGVQVFVNVKVWVERAVDKGETAICLVQALIRNAEARTNIAKTNRLFLCMGGSQVQPGNATRLKECGQIMECLEMA
jgi:hypothetical protein